MSMHLPRISISRRGMRAIHQLASGANGVRITVQRIRLFKGSIIIVFPHAIDVKPMHTEEPNDVVVVRRGIRIAIPKEDMVRLSRGSIGAWQLTLDRWYFCIRSRPFSRASP